MESNLIGTTSESNTVMHAALQNDIVLGRILSLLHLEELKNSRSVCRLWRDSAMEILKKKTLFKIWNLEKSYKSEKDCFCGSNPEIFYNVWVLDLHVTPEIGTKTWAELLVTNIPIQNGLLFRLCDQIRSLFVEGRAIENLVPGINRGDFLNLKVIEIYHAAENPKGVFTRAALPSLETLIIQKIGRSLLESSHPLFYQGLLETAPNLQKLHTCVFLNLGLTKKLRMLSLNNDPAGNLIYEMLSTVSGTLEQLYLRNPFSENALSNLPKLKVLEMGEMKPWDSGKSWNPELITNCPKLEVLFWLYPQTYIESSPSSLKRLELCCCGLYNQYEEHGWIKNVCKHLSQHLPNLPLFVVAKNCRFEDSTRHEDNKGGFKGTRELYENIINTNAGNITIKAGIGHSLPKLMYIWMVLQSLGGISHKEF